MLQIAGSLSRAWKTSFNLQEAFQGLGSDAAAKNPCKSKNLCHLCALLMRCLHYAAPVGMTRKMVIVSLDCFVAPLLAMTLY